MVIGLTLVQMRNQRREAIRAHAAGVHWNLGNKISVLFLACACTLPYTPFFVCCKFGALHIN